MDWLNKAACKNDTRTFFTPSLERVAKQMCRECPVRLECLDYALKTHQEFGVWGGLTEDERRNRRRSVIPSNERIVQVTYTTNARSTGATCSAGRSETGWSVLCRRHGSRASAASRTVAEYAVSRPEEWCAGCSRISEGLAPRSGPSLQG